MAAEFRISIDLSGLIPVGAPITKDSFPTLSYAVRRLTEAAHQNWVAYASGAPLPNGKIIASRTGEYARSIQVRETGDFSGEVYSDLAYATQIEEGAPARDLKQILNSSLKVRLTHDGKRYLIIPFRFNHPNSVMGNNMPESVYSWWGQGRTASSVNGTYRRVSGTGAHDIKTRQALTVPGWRYKWGTRLNASDLEGMGVKGHMARRMAGMVNFRNPGSTGGSSHSQFITFRTMVEGSKGWVTKPTEGKWPARTVAETLRPIAEEQFKIAMAEDIRHLLGGETV